MFENICNNRKAILALFVGDENDICRQFWKMGLISYKKYQYCKIKIVDILRYFVFMIWLDLIWLDEANRSGFRSLSYI